MQRAGSHRLPESSLVDGWEAKISASRRNFFQVRRASSVYAVGWRLCEGVNPLTFEPLPAGEQGQGIDVGGGTGWAFQFYIDRFGPGGEDPSSCRLYFFDNGGPPFARQDSRTSGRWSLWDVENETWLLLEGQPPAPAGLYAGIGACSLEGGGGVEAIKKLYIGDDLLPDAKRQRCC